MPLSFKAEEMETGFILCKAVKTGRRTHLLSRIGRLFDALRFRSRTVRACATAILAFAFSVLHSPAEVIADYGDDFQAGTPSAGWSYYWNAPQGWPLEPDQSSAFLLSSVTSYTELAPAGLRYTPDGNEDFEDDFSGGYLFCEAGGGHPGIGGLENAGGPVGVDRYAISGYSVAVEGNYRLTATSIQLTDTRSNGIRLVVMEPGPEIHLQTVVLGGQSSSFDCDLGHIPAGGEILVAVGPNGHSGFDTYLMDYSIERYVPEFEEYYLEDFGAVGDGITDDGPALRAAAAALSNLSTPRILHFGHGRSYRMGQHAPAHGTLVFRESSNLVIEGNGSKIINHPENRTFTFYKSDSVTVRNLILDMDPLPFTQGRIVALDTEGNSLDVAIEPGYADPVIGSGFTDHPDNDVMLFDGSTREPVHRFSRKREVLESGNGIFRIFFYGTDLVEGAKIGDLVTVKINGDTFDSGMDLQDVDGSYIRPPVGLIYASYCDKLTLENITSYASPTMVVATWDCDGLKFRRFENLRKPGTNRLTSGNKDILHLKLFANAPVIQDCRFDSTNDDAINISQPTACILEIDSGQRVRVRGDDLFWFNLPIAVNDRLIHYNEAQAFNGEYRVTAVESINRLDAWIEVSPSFQQMPVAGDFLCALPESPAIIQRCEFSRMFQRALLVRVPCLIEDIRQQGGSASFPPSISPPEGPSPYEQNLYRSIISGSDPDFDQPVMILHQFNRPGNYSVRVMDNVIYRNSNSSVPVGFYNADGIEYKGNRIIHPEPSSSATYMAQNSTNITVEDNRSLVGDYDPDGDGWSENSTREAYFSEASVSPTYLFGGSYGAGPWTAGAGVTNIETLGAEIHGVTSSSEGYLENSDTWIHGALTERVIVVMQASSPGSAMLRWQAEDDPGFIGERSLAHPVIGGNSIETLVFEVADNSAWEPRWIRALRFTPIDSMDQSFAIRAICFSAGDADKDGIPDNIEGSLDTDEDGWPDLLDWDSDGDGIPDSVEAWRDSNGDGKYDRHSKDSDSDGIPDWFEWNRSGFCPIRQHQAMANSTAQKSLYTDFVTGLDTGLFPLEVNVTDGYLVISGKVGPGRSVSLQRSENLDLGWDQIAQLEPLEESFSYLDEFVFGRQFYRATAFLDDTNLLAHEGFHASADIGNYGSGFGFSGGFRPLENLLINGSSELFPGLQHNLKDSSGHSFGLTMFGPELSRATYKRGLEISSFSEYSSTGVSVDTGTIYISWLYSPGQTSGAFLDRFVILNGTQEVWSLRFQQDNPDYRVEASGLNHATGVYPEASRTDLFVLRIDFNSSGQDVASLYINPMDFSEPSTPTIQNFGEFGFNEFLLERLGFFKTSEWDEISFARTFRAACLGSFPK